MATSAAAVKEDPATTFAKDQLKAISDDIRDVYAEAKGNGFDVKALRTIVRLRKQDANERAEEETILETYMQALGMLRGARRLRILSLVVPANAGTHHPRPS